MANPTGINQYTKGGGFGKSKAEKRAAFMAKVPANKRHLYMTPADKRSSAAAQHEARVKSIQTHSARRGMATPRKLASMIAVGLVKR